MKNEINDEVELLLNTGKVSKEEIEAWLKVKGLLMEKDNSFTSLCIRKSTFDRFQNVKDLLEVELKRNISNDKGMNLILDIVEALLKNKNGNRK